MGDINKYELIINLDSEMKNVYKRSFESNGYEIIAETDNLIFARKILDASMNLKNEKILVNFTLSMVKKYSSYGVLCLDLSNDYNIIMNFCQSSQTRFPWRSFLPWDRRPPHSVLLPLHPSLPLPPESCPLPGRR